MTNIQGRGTRGGPAPLESRIYRVIFFKNGKKIFSYQSGPPQVKIVPSPLSKTVHQGGGGSKKSKKPSTWFKDSPEVKIVLKRVYQPEYPLVFVLHECLSSKSNIYTQLMKIVEKNIYYLVVPKYPLSIHSHEFAQCDTTKLSSSSSSSRLNHYCKQKWTHLLLYT